MSETLPLIRAKDVCRHLSLSIPKVYQLVATGRLRSVRIGAAIRFRQSDVQAFIESSLTGGEPPAA